MRPHGDDAARFDSVPNVFGLWTTTRAPAAGDPALAPAAFDIGARAGADDEVLLWRMTLPASARLAAARLAASAMQLQEVDAALLQCEDRIAALVRSNSRGVSFDIPSAGALPAAERDLMQVLDAFQGAHQPAAFGLAGDLAGRWRQMATAWQSFMDRLERYMSHYAWVETEIGEKLIGRTVLGWSGDLHTVWRPSVSAVHATLHESALSLAVGSRDRWIQALVTVSRGAVLLASLPALLATPLGAVAALPAAWRFVSHVITLLDSSDSS